MTCLYIFVDFGNQLGIDLDSVDVAGHTTIK